MAMVIGSVNLVAGCFEKPGMVVSAPRVKNFFLTMMLQLAYTYHVHTSRLSLSLCVIINIIYIYIYIASMWLCSLRGVL